MAGHRVTQARRKAAPHAEPPFALEGIDHVLLLVKGMAPAVRWAMPPFAGGRNLDHLCLALGRHDEANLRRHLARHHVEIIEEGVHGASRGESLSLHVRDPSGNVIELKGSPPA